MATVGARMWRAAGREVPEPGRREKRNSNESRYNWWDPNDYFSGTMVTTRRSMRWFSTAATSNVKSCQVVFSPTAGK
jgi:hypothetical protein